VEDLEDAEWMTSKIEQGYQQRNVSREHVKDSSGMKWCSHHPWSPTFSNGVDLKKKKKKMGLVDLQTPDLCVKLMMGQR